MEKGFIHIYCGDGKGKTTAAVGLAVRASGRGRRVHFVQFLKGDDSGERRALELLPGVTLAPCPKVLKFTFAMTEAERAEEANRCEALFQNACELAKAGRCDLLVLDEVFGALQCGMLQRERVLAFLREKPEPLEVALTGRDPGEDFLDLSDYVSEICKRKHPFDRGISAREAVEY
jgi:cob(I)alamin adenosyltransferase